MKKNNFINKTTTVKEFIEELMKHNQDAIIEVNYAIHDDYFKDLLRKRVRIYLKSDVDDKIVYPKPVKKPGYGTKRTPCMLSPKKYKVAGKSKTKKD